MNRRGSILIAVLLLAGLLAVFVAIVTEVLRAADDSTRGFAEDIRAQIAGRAAIERIVAPFGITLQQLRGPATVHLTNADIAVVVSDEAGRIDLNRAPASVLAGLFRNLGVDAEAATTYASRILDWRDDDDEAEDKGGAERNDYRAAGRVDGPRNGPFVRVSELALVLGIPVQVAAAAAPYVTVAGGLSRVNALVADPLVLLSLPGMTEITVRDFLQDRDRWDGPPDALLRRLGPAQRYATGQAGKAVRMEMRVRLNARSERRYEAVVAVVEGDDEPYRIVSWEDNPPVKRAATLPAR